MLILEDYRDKNVFKLMDISIIILNYKSERHLGRCIESLQKYLSVISHEIIIVNNDAEPLTSTLPLENLQIINNPINEGFAKACNRGAKISQGKILFFLNPDTEILSGNFTDLVAAFNDSSVGIVSPQLINTAGAVQPWSAGYKINLSEVILNNLGFIRSKKLWKNNLATAPDWISGAALAINSELFKKINGFDENFFMYFEDVDLCKRVKEESLSVSILPTLKVLHLSGQSSSSLNQQKKYYYASQDYYFKKHFGLLSLNILRVLRKLMLLLKGQH